MEVYFKEEARKYADIANRVLNLVEFPQETSKQLGGSEMHESTIGRHLPYQVRYFRLHNTSVLFVMTLHLMMHKARSGL